MSHKITATIELYDRDAVRETLESMDVEVQENAVWSGWRGRQRTEVDFLVPPNRDRAADQWYGIGFRAGTDGNLEIIQESMSGQGSKDLVKQFTDRYQVNVAKSKLKAMGYEIIPQSDGTFRARATMKTARLLAEAGIGGSEKSSTRRRVRVGR